MLHILSHALKTLAAMTCAAVCLTACFDKTISDYDYTLEDGKVMAYDHGTPFDGVTWTDDGSSARLVFDNGELKAIEYFTGEGKCYCILDAVEQQSTFYNGAGGELQRGAFRHLYHDQYREWRRLNEDIWAVFQG